MSNFKQDFNAEHHLGTFMNWYLYGPLGVNYNRITAKADQLAGTDVRIYTENGDINIDEKASLYYMNRNLGTFAFELEYVARKKRKAGWLYNENLVTTHYMIIYPESDGTELAHIKASSFTGATCYLISKNAIHDYLEPFKEEIENTATMMFNNNFSGRHNPCPGNGFTVFRSAQLKEKPINVLIDREILGNLATNVMRIQKNKPLEWLK